jgi:hypothetical protein
MLLPTWTIAELQSELRPYECHVWRVVEGQHLVSTRKIVDTNAEQNVLEDLIEATKPAVPDECRGLDYLLSTPFRYRPAYRGSRFRHPGLSPGVFYAAEDPSTAVAEMAFYRLLFYAESPTTPWPVNPSEYSGFSSSVRTSQSLDLTRAPLNADRVFWRDPIEYDPCRKLADAAREVSAKLLRYESARDPQNGACVAVLTCPVFVETHPLDYQTWRIGVGASGAYALREFPRAQIEFDRTEFASDPRIAEMRWDR